MFSQFVWFLESYICVILHPWSIWLKISLFIWSKAGQGLVPADQKKMWSIVIFEIGPTNHSHCTGFLRNPLIIVWTLCFDQKNVCWIGRHFNLHQWPAHEIGTIGMFSSIKLGRPLAGQPQNLLDLAWAMAKQGLISTWCLISFLSFLFQFEGLLGGWIYFSVVFANGVDKRQPPS